MNKIAVCSMFRDSDVWQGMEIRQVDRFFKQMNEQQGVELEFFLLEGDSQDETFNKLNFYAREDARIHIMQKTASYGAVASTEDGNRIRSLSQLGTAVVNLAKENSEADYLFFVESDLVLPPTLLPSLLKGFDANKDVGVVAPIVMLENTSTFYDTWGFRDLGSDNRWNSHKPYSGELDKHEHYVPMNSIGSCALIKMECIKRGANFNDGAFVEMCRQIRALGYTIYVDKLTNIWHPAKRFISGRWV